MDSVVSSITQIMIDSHYRSIDGFLTLLKKEWTMGNG
jgi:hypothetical protein